MKIILCKTVNLFFFIRLLFMLLHQIIKTIKFMKNKMMQRQLMGGIVRQKIENEMLCLTDLAQIYESQRTDNGWVEKRFDHFFSRESEIEYIIELLDLQGIFINVQKYTFIEHIKNQGLIKALKEIGQYKVTGKGENKLTFCNPYIFIAVAQWLNPRFRAMVTIWVTDNLILNRIEAGHGYSQMCSAISDHIVPKISDNEKKYIYSSFAKLVNEKVFGRHEENLRQIASKEQISELNKIQNKLSALIEVGYVKNITDAKRYLKL